MKRVLIGHRGVGKTSLLKRHSGYFPKIKHFDLDREIESSTGTDIRSYFQNNSEKDFRKKEQELFQKLTSENSEYVISLGAGFDLSQLPLGIDVYYVSRVTDKDGRIFLNRPRLNTGVSALEEYKQIFKARTPNYFNAAKKIYHMPEGLDTENDIEKKIMCETFKVQEAYYTLTARELNSIAELLNCYKKIELRTDLLSYEVIQNLLNSYPQQDWLVSVRTSEVFNFKNAKCVDVDYRFYSEGCQILSSHVDSIDQGINQLGAIKEKPHLKLSPLVENFTDLVKGYSWQQQDPQNRSFLPRSNNGKWVWYRQLCKYIQKINFIRNFTELADQPSLSEWLLLPNEKPATWAAVLGKPIHFSRSPLRHLKYFSEKDTFFTKIEMDTQEFSQQIHFLIDLGLQSVAVTSPLKTAAFQLSDEKTEAAIQFKTANTLYIKNRQILSHNTDVAGFKELVKNIKPTDDVAVWGGGGTLDMMKSILPRAHFYSSRTSQLRESLSSGLTHYDYLVWAAPRTALARWPQDQLQFNSVIDLNYTENSMGLEFAADQKIGYTSGYLMFDTQAENQQEFWSAHEC